MVQMNGLELAEAYYSSHGRKMIDTLYPEFRSRIAAGLVGMGSDCYGFDDDVSRDHDWGPGFCLWLEENDYRLFGAKLQQSYEALPQTFNGYRRKYSKWGNNRVGVMEIGSFYSYFIGSPNAPETLMKWLIVPEENFAACTNGKVFCDPLGKFSAIRKTIKDYYPEDVRLKKIAARCMIAAQSGQYNFARCLQRNDQYSAHCTLIRFCEALISLVFLLNKKYCPYYKWNRKAAKNLPLMGVEVAQGVEMLVRAEDPLKKNSLIEKLCSKIIKSLKNQGLSNSNSDFLLEHGPIVQSKIRNEQLRRLDVWYSGG